MAHKPLKKLSYTITFVVTDADIMRADALKWHLAGGGSEADFISMEHLEDKIADTPVDVWLYALMDNAAEYGEGLAEISHSIDHQRFYRPPKLPEGFDPATSISALQIARLMKIALTSGRWSGSKLELPKRYKSLVKTPEWYAEPALYESTKPWSFQITLEEFDRIDPETMEFLTGSAVYTIRSSDIPAALERLAKDRPRRILEIMRGEYNYDLADIFFQTLVFKEFCHYDEY